MKEKRLKDAENMASGDKGFTHMKVRILYLDK